MKNRLCLIILIASLSSSQAQSVLRHELALSFGVGGNLAFNNFVGGGEFLQSTITYSGMVDYSLWRVFSLGVAATTQSFDVSSLNHPVNVVTKTNVGIRPVFHLNSAPGSLHDIYLGGRIGHTFWSGYSDPPGSYSFESALQYPVSFQLIFGFTYYPVRFLGINVESGAFGPYLLHLGLKFRAGKSAN